MDLTDELTAKMLAEYQAAYDQILGKLTTARGDLSYSAYAKQTQLLKQIGKILDRFEVNAGGYLETALKSVARVRTEQAIADIEATMPSMTHAVNWHLDFNENAVMHTYRDAYQHIAGRTENMKATVKQMLRDESALIFRRASVEGISTRVAHRRLMSQIMTKSPDFRFIDRAGKQWDNRVYFKMLSHTVMSQAANDCYMNTLTNEGHDLVQVSPNGAKDACRKWEGKVLSITGKTEGYPTLAEAKATNEIFHPRCRHTLVAYNPEMEAIFNAS